MSNSRSSTTGFLVSIFSEISFSLASSSLASQKGHVGHLGHSHLDGLNSLEKNTVKLPCHQLLSRMVALEKRSQLPRRMVLIGLFEPSICINPFLLQASTGLFLRLVSASPSAALAPDQRELRSCCRAALSCCRVPIDRSPTAAHIHQKTEEQQTLCHVVCL